MSNEVSIVIPAYNAGRFIAKALTSLERQTQRPNEIIVVDDGSSDCTSELVAKFNAQSALDIRALRQSNKGPSAARNLGVDSAKGELIGFLDADDVVYPEFVASTVAGLRRNPTWVTCFSDRDVVRIDGSLIAKDLDHPKFRALHKTAVGGGYFELDDRTFFSKMIGGSVIPMTILVRRSAFDAVGGFDEEIRMGEDQLFMLSLIKHGGKFGYIDRSLGTWQRHDDNATSSKNAPVACRYADMVVSKLLGRKSEWGLTDQEIEEVKRARKKIGPGWVYATSSNGLNETLPLSVRLLLHRRISPLCFSKAIARWMLAVGTRRERSQAS